MKIKHKFSFIIPHLAYNTANGDRVMWFPQTGEFAVLVNADLLFEKEPDSMTARQVHEIINSLIDATPAQKEMYHRRVDARKD